LRGEVLEAQLDYWRRQLGPDLPLLELPTDHPRPAVQSFAGARESCVLSESLLASLKALSQSEGATLFMTLAAGLKVLFHRYTGQSVITIGTPVANRGRSELEPLIGFFVNSLVLNTELKGTLSFREALARVREVSLGAYAHQDLPFEQLVEAVNPERDQSRHPLYQVMFVLQNASAESMELPGLRLSTQPVARSSAQFDLTVRAEEGHGGLELAIEYNTDLFEPDTIQRLLGHYETLLTGAVANPEQAISQLPILSEREHKQLADWGAIQTEFPSASGIHERFEAQVARTPDATAVAFEEERLTYGQLNRRANQLAHHLRGLGVGPNVLVGLCVDRSLEMVVGILGILKAGGAYVPLDTTHPDDRLNFILKDARVSVLLTQGSLAQRFGEQDPVVIRLDEDCEALAREAAENPRWEGGVNSPAYVIYTSGSTGKPKGVLVSHANVVRLFDATQAWYQFDDKDVWTLFHSYAFDFSVWELWGALFYGGKVVVVPYWASRTPDAFYDLLIEEQVTVLNQTPSAFRQLIQTDEAKDTDGTLALRLVIFGGEALDLQSLRPWFDRHGDQRPQLVNMYGITETTVHVSYRPLTLADVSGASGSLIGRPIPDLQIHVVDQYSQPVPVGVPGEMLVGGAGVALGYLDRPGLTAERFVPNPVSAAAGARLYRTGDLLRYRPDGDLEYLGRIDHQVKIRGFRIELGEIESVLAAHPAVRETVVLIQGDVPDDKRIVAYVVPADGGLSTRDLRQSLKHRLPEYMVPAHFVLLDALPLTPNGKVDRRALPDPEVSRSDLDESFVPPRSAMEKTLARIWEQLLGVDRVGVQENFFELGGHSLLATRVVSMIREELHVDVKLMEFFDRPTIADLAESLEDMLWLTAGRPGDSDDAPLETEEGGI
jgi:amino acid adenylation domain-containing protein